MRYITMIHGRMIMSSFCQAFARPSALSDDCMLETTDRCSTVASSVPGFSLGARTSTPTGVVELIILPVVKRRYDN